MEKVHPINLGIKSWALEDQPRQKMASQGRQALTDAELVAILIGSGTRHETALDVAKRILSRVDHNLHELGRLSIDDLKKVPGIGEAKAITISAALELGLRRGHQEPLNRVVVDSSVPAYNVMYPILADLPVEQFWVLLLNHANRVLDKVFISQGSFNATVADPKVIFKYVIDRMATGIVLCHNHPSGSVEPSKLDQELTDRLVAAAEIFGIRVVDHIIIGDDKYYSFADNRLL